MEPAKVDLLIVLFAYAGNGGIASTIPEIAFWLAETLVKIKRDPRINRIGLVKLADTPITMTRNLAARMAIAGEYDMLLMLDSDNQPDAYMGRDQQAKPFWDEAFSLSYERLQHGKPTIVAAPYCGPPPMPGELKGGEIPYLFHWENNESDTGEPAYVLRLISRHEASLMQGMQRVAALPTGCCLITTNTFDGMTRPLFYYEFNEDHSEKKSTEDVVFTRNASLHHMQTHGENVCFAACDSWAFHAKTKYVGRPTTMPVELVADDLRSVVLAGKNAGDKIVDLMPPQSQRVQPIVETVYTPPMPEVTSTTETPPDVWKAMKEAADLYGKETAILEPIGYGKAAPIEDDGDIEQPPEPPEEKEPGYKTINWRGRALRCREDRVLSEADCNAIVEFVRLTGVEAQARIVLIDHEMANRSSAFGDIVYLAGALPFDGHEYFPGVMPNQDADGLWMGWPDERDPQRFIQELRDWYRHLRPGGIVGGIGYCTDETVTAALAEIEQATHCKIEQINGTSVWYFRRPE